MLGHEKSKESSIPVVVDAFVNTLGKGMKISIDELVLIGRAGKLTK